MARPQPSAAAKRLCVGIVAGAHGIRGAVRVKSFTADPSDIGAYGPVSDETGARHFALRVVGQTKGVVLAELDGVTDRDSAEALKGLHLYVERTQLPPAEDDEFYHADLLGLSARLTDGTVLGQVTGLYEFGAGDSVEITGPAGAITMVPFTKAAVPVIDLAGGMLIIDPPAGLLEKPAPPASLADQEAAMETAGRVAP
jgi:16S rRNA processing protein RimM